MSSLSPDDALQVEAVCNRFEAAWKAGPRPQIDLYLRNAAEPARQVLLVELVQLDLAYRRRAGETPVVKDYLPRFPEQASLIAALFQAPDEPVSLPEKTPVGEAGDTGAEAPGDQQALAPVEGPGTRIGPYKLLHKLGEGGMGTVWMAEQEQPVRRRVALKIIKAGMDSAHVIARFEQERQALALMDHPHIAKVFDAGATAAGRPYFVMELVKGVPISKYCDQERLTLKERLELFVPVCQAVQHAHQKGIIHRDLKPSNVLVALYDGQPVPKVIDFGVAKATAQQLTEKTVFTEVGQIVGTLEYMAPEQAELNNLDIDTRADIYALGVILYELLTGSTPFTRQQLRGVAFTEMLRLIREVEPPRPSTRLSSSAELPGLATKRKLEPRRLARLVQGELDWIVMKCLEKERGRRYETANGLAMDVQRYLADEPVLAGPPGAAYRLRKFAHKYQKALVTATAIVILLACAAVFSSSWAVRATRAEADAVRAQGEEASRRQEADDQRQRAEQAEQEAKANAVKAGAEAAIAKAVNEFLQKDLLGQAYIGNQPLLGGVTERNRNITVGELLDRAAKAIEGKFAEQPQTEAAIRLTLGNTYGALGRLTEAQPHLERSVRLRTTQLGADHLDTLGSKNSLAELYYAQGKLDRAELLVQEVLDGRTAQLGADHPDTLTSKNDLAGLYWTHGKYDRAETLLKEVLDARTTRLSADHPDTLGAKHSLALLYRGQGKYDRAEPLQKEVLDGLTAQLGADHPDTLLSKNNLAELYYAQGKYDRAETLYQEAIDAQTARLGADHPDTLTSKNNLAVLYSAQMKHDRAETLYQQALEGRTTRLGADHPDTLTSKHNLALLYKTQGKYDRAEPLLKEVLDARTAWVGADHLVTLTSKHSLAELYWAQEQYDLAEPLFREAVEGTRKKLGLAHPTTQSAVTGLVICYEKMGQPAKGEPLLRENADFWKQQAGADSLQYAGDLALLGLNLLRQQKFADADPLLRDCLVIRGMKQPEEWTTFNTKSMLGGALLGEQKYAEAEPLLRQGYEGMKQQEAKIPAMGKARLTEALERLVQLYDAWGKKDKADEWRKKLEETKAAAQPPAKP
jgi:serine/threonine protein kinase/lipopolysaccharide biosynthesis regulator YciM